MPESAAEWRNELDSLIAAGNPSLLGIPDDGEPESAPDPQPGVEPAAAAPSTDALQEPGAPAPQPSDVADSGNAAADTPESTNPATQAEQAPAAEAASSAAVDQPPQELKPFAFRVDGREVSVPGASRVAGKTVDGQDANYIVIEENAFNRHVQPYLADRSVWRQKDHQYQQQIAALDPANNEVVQYAGLLASEIHGIFNDTGDGRSWEDKLLTWGHNLRERHGALVQQAQALSAQRQDAARGSVLTEEQQSERIAYIESAVAAEVDKEIAANPAYAGIDLDEVRNDLALTVRLGGLAALIKVAPQDFPEWGVRRGQPYVDLGLIRHVLDRSASHSQRITAAERARLDAESRLTAAEAERRAAEVERANRAVVAPPAPTVGSVRPSAAPGSVPARPKSRAEWEESFNNEFINPAFAGHTT